MNSQTQPILTTKELTCGYDHPLLRQMTFDLPANCFILIEGPNGIGKSTFLKTITGLVEPLSGNYEWRCPKDEIRYVPQVRTLDPVLPATVGDVLNLGQLQGWTWSFDFDSDAPTTDRVLETVGLDQSKQTLFRELSEGQKQLVLLARALVGKPRVVLLDEPTASMDPKRAESTIELLRTQTENDNLSLFMVAHGSDLARKASDSILTISRDRSVSIRESEYAL